MRIFVFEFMYTLNPHHAIFFSEIEFLEEFICLNFYARRKEFIDFDSLYEEYHLFRNTTSYPSSISWLDIDTTVIQKVSDDMG